MMSELERLLQGIDKTETENENGWWETSAGAEMGSKVLDSIKQLQAENARLRQRVYDVLNVKSKDGLLSSEWIARTGVAERRAKQLQAENARLKAALDAISKVQASPDKLKCIFIIEGCAATAYTALYGTPPPAGSDDTK